MPPRQKRASGAVFAALTQIGETAKRSERAYCRQAKARQWSRICGFDANRRNREGVPRARLEAARAKKQNATQSIEYRILFPSTMSKRPKIPQIFWEGFVRLLSSHGG